MPTTSIWDVAHKHPLVIYSLTWNWTFKRARERSTPGPMLPLGELHVGGRLGRKARGMQKLPKRGAKLIKEVVIKGKKGTIFYEKNILCKNFQSVIFLCCEGSRLGREEVLHRPCSNHYATQMPDRGLLSYYSQRCLNS